MRNGLVGRHVRVDDASPRSQRQLLAERSPTMGLINRKAEANEPGFKESGYEAARIRLEHKAQRDKRRWSG